MPGMFVWWSDPYVFLSLAVLVLSTFLLVRITRTLIQRRSLGIGAKILLGLWLLAAMPWIYVTDNIVSSAGSPIHKPAPPLLLTPANGKPLHLENLKGKLVLLDFWATWCARVVRASLLLPL